MIRIIRIKVIAKMSRRVDDAAHECVAIVTSERSEEDDYVRGECEIHTMSINDS